MTIRLCKKSYILEKCNRRCNRKCNRVFPVISTVFGLKVTRLHFFSIEKKIKEVKAKKIYAVAEDARTL